MPHDSKGRIVRVGDRVVATGVVTSVSPGEDYCNFDVELDAPETFPAEQAHMKHFVGNTRLFTVLEESDGV